MRRGQKIALSIALVVGGSLTMCKLAYPTYTYRYKMTINVEADGKLYSGSSVIEVRLVKQMQLTTEMPPVATEVSVPSLQTQVIPKAVYEEIPPE